MKPLGLACPNCPHCIKKQAAYGQTALVCMHPKTCERISNPQGLRIDKPKEYIQNNGFPDWCPLPSGTIIEVKK